MAKWLAILMAIWQIASMEIKQWKDDEGDLSAGLEAGHLTVFATKQASGAWVVSFALTSELEDLENAETLTGFGAFSTIRLIRPAVKGLIKWIENTGAEWSVCCEKRRAKLYARYIPNNKIQIITL
jgi:hypothetical protein